MSYERGETEMGMGDESRVKSEERMNDEDCTFSELSM